MIKKESIAKNKTFSQLDRYLKNAPVAIAILTRDDYRFAAVNDRYLNNFGRTKEQVLHQKLFDIIPELEPRVKHLLDTVIETGENFRTEGFPVDIVADGETKRNFYSFTHEPFREADSGEIIGIFVTGYQVTEQVIAQNSLLKSEEQLRLIADAMPVLISYISHEERYEFNNKRYEEWFGWRAADVKGKKLGDVLGEDAYSAILPYVKRALAGERLSYDALIPYAYRGNCYVTATYVPDITKEGFVRGFYALVADINERKALEEATKHSEYYFRSLADDVPVMIWLTNPEGYCVYLNREWYDATGQTPDEAAGFGWLSATHPDDAEDAASKFRKATEERKDFTLVYRLRFKNGEYRWVVDKGRPRFNDKGVFEGFIGSVVDIHQEIEAEQRILEGEEKYKSLFDTMEQGFCIIELIFDEDNKPVDYWFVEVNPVFSSQTGLLDVKGKSARELLPGLEQHWFDLYGKVASTGESIRFSEGSDVMGRWFDVYAFKVGGSQRNRVALLFSDISERKKVEEQLKASEERFRAMVTATSDGIYRMSPDWKVMRELEGSGSLSSTGNPIENWMERYIHPDDRENLEKAIKTAIANKSVFELEHQVRRADGSFGWTFSRAVPILDEEGEIVEWFGAARDVTERHQADRALKESESKFRNLANQLEQIVEERTHDLNRSNEDLQQFAHVASHDLKEPVRKVKTFIDRFRGQFGSTLPQKAEEYLEKMDKALDRMNNMIDGVLKYSSIDATEQKSEWVNIDTVVANVENDLEILIHQKKARIEYQNLPGVMGSQLLLYQLFYNLVNNSLKFSKKDVPPVITIESPTPSEEDMLHFPKEDKRSIVKFVITDNGIGFRQNEAERIFGTFTRLHPKDHYEGTGLGLSLCSNIVHRHKGVIYATGEEGKGATFTILLPVGTRSEN